MPELQETRVEPESIFVAAYDYASAYDLKTAHSILEKDLSGKVLVQDPLLVEFKPDKMTAVFDYGSIVFFNFDHSECKQLMETLRPCAQRVNKVISDDEFLLYLTPRQKKPEGTDELYVKEFNRDIALVVSAVLSRSVSVEYYETLVGNALAQVEETIDALATKGWMPRRPRDLTKKVGFALSIEHELAYSVSVFDDPDIVWDGGVKISQLYSSLKREFDLEARIKVIQQKVSIISRSSTFILSRLEAARSSMLELIIVLLILSEILLALIGKI